MTSNVNSSIAFGHNRRDKKQYRKVKKAVMARNKPKKAPKISTKLSKDQKEWLKQYIRDQKIDLRDQNLDLNKVPSDPFEPLTHFNNRPHTLWTSCWCGDCHSVNDDPALFAKLEYGPETLKVILHEAMTNPDVTIPTDRGTLTKKKKAFSFFIESDGLFLSYYHCTSSPKEVVERMLKSPLKVEIKCIAVCRKVHADPTKGVHYIQCAVWLNRVIRFKGKRLLKGFGGLEGVDYKSFDLREADSVEGLMEYISRSTDVVYHNYVPGDTEVDGVFW